MAITEEMIQPQMLSLREFRPFKSSDEYLWAMKEDLSDWLKRLYPDLDISAENFMECLETGIVLCKVNFASIFFLFYATSACE